MIVQMRYSGRSAIVNGLRDARLRFAANRLREPTFFRGELAQPILFREALAALYRVVVSDYKYRPRDRVEFRAWLEEQDRRFLARWMPELERYFHYRNLDVSTLKELARRWAPEVAAGVAKESRHTALADVHESIAELRHYRAALFAAPWNLPRA